MSKSMAMLPAVMSSLLLLCGLATALDVDISYDDDGGDSHDGAVEAASPRFLYFNSTSTATALTLLGALILLGVIFYLVYVGGLLSPTVSNKNGYGYNRNDYYYPNQDQFRARSAGEDSVFSAMSVLKWISMMQEMYEKFDYTDLECQKRLICDVMQERDFFGSVASRMETGFKLAKYLEALNMPDDLRELLDEYTDASERAAGKKECHEYFQCPYSLKDAVKRNFANSL